MPENDPHVYLVVGYDGSDPANRALDAAVRLLRGRQGGIDVVYVANLPGVDSLSFGAVAEMEADFDDIEKELRATVAERLNGLGVAWDFQRRQGPIAHELIEAATAVEQAHPGDTTVVVVGSSSHAAHRLVGSVAVGLARRCPVPLTIVP